MSDYLIKVLKASGGHAAPAETLQAEQKEAPEGYHYMPDGKLMKDSDHEAAARPPAPEGYHYMPDGELMPDSAHEAAALEKDSDDPCWKGYVQLGTKKGKNGQEVPNCVPIDQSADGITAAALEKDSDDPCWKGYVQVGMKKKNGKEVPNCVPSSASIDEIVLSINSEFGVSRQVATESAYEVARNACDKYSYLGDTEELASAILWEVFSYVEYATSGTSEDLDQMREYADLMPEGHPEIGGSLVSSALWISGAPDLDDSAKHALLTAYSESSDYVAVLHATTYLNVLLASGNVSLPTRSQIASLSTSDS